MNGRPGKTLRPRDRLSQAGSQQPALAEAVAPRFAVDGVALQGQIGSGSAAALRSVLGGARARTSAGPA